MSKPDFEPDYYTIQIELMKSRFELLFSSWGLRWDKFYRNIESRIGHKKYYEWVFLCGLDPVISEAGRIEGKKAKMDFLTESSKGRLLDICLPDDRVDFFLRNL